MPKTNHLTKESNAIWASALRDHRNGKHLPNRGEQRAIEWATWRATEAGVSFPASYETRLVGDAVCFTTYVEVEVPGSRVKLRGGGYDGGYACSTKRERQVFATIHLPAWCCPVKDAEAWLAANL